MGYTKLFHSIITSTVWQEPLATKVVWVTMLALSNQHGEVSASVPGLAKLAGVSIAETEAALDTFLAPDPYSRTTDNEGRRIEPCEGGWRILNHAKYRARENIEDRARMNADRQARYRERQRQRNDVASRGVTDGYGNAVVTKNNDKQMQMQMQMQKQMQKQMQVKSYPHVEGGVGETSQAPQQGPAVAGPAPCNRHDGQSQSGARSLLSSAPKPARPAAPPADDDAWLAELAADPANAGLDVQREFAKCRLWCSTHGKTLSRRRFTNWLLRAEKPMQKPDNGSLTAAARSPRDRHVGTDAYHDRMQARLEAESAAADADPAAGLRGI